LLALSAVDYTYTFRVLTDNLGRVEPGSIAATIMSTCPSKDRIIALSLSVLKISHRDLPEIEEFARTRLPELERVGIDLNTIERWKFHLNRIDRWEKGVNVDESTEQWTLWLDKLLPLTSEESRERMQHVNPIYIPRQSLMERAIKRIEESGDCTEVEKLLNLFLSPFVDDPKVDKDVYAKPDMSVLCSRLSCSS
jgi:uncharacterized protein YdiU (UPF0061 family)